MVRQLDTAREHVNLGGRAAVRCSARLRVRIGGLNVPVHRGGELVKGQQVFFVLRQAAHCFPDSAERTWL
jgi:hypothetical protein